MTAAHIDESHHEQSVRQHCENTALYAADNAAAIKLYHTLYLAGLLHDIGKNTQAFDEYIRKAHDGQTVARGSINHSSAGAKYLMEQCKPKTPVEAVTQQLIAYAVISHHGLNDCLTYDGEDKYAARIDPERDICYDEAIRNSRDIFAEHDIKELFEKSCGEISEKLSVIEQTAPKMSGGKGVEEKCFMQGCLQRLVLSALMDADRRDTAEFMSGVQQKRLNAEERKAYFEECLEKLKRKLDSFAVRNHIDELRREMSQQCAEFAEKNGNGIYKLTIPTGGGKTYSSMRYALMLAIKEGKDRIIYTAPFLSILEQNAADLKKVFGESDYILEHHSNVLFDGEEDQENIKKYELLSEDWSSPVILTTMVRFLDVLFGGSSRDIRRMHQLKNSVLIIDEAQSVPVRYINLFNTMLNFLSEVCGTTIVMCTATQPIFERTARPLLYAENSSIISDVQKYSQLFKRAEIVADYALKKCGTEELAELILEHTEKNALVILNTKSAVQKLYDYFKENCFGEYRLIQLTTYMCAQHRLDLIEEMKEALKNNEKILCISTQLIEAGVDISFETVFRSLSGLDSIAQAAGRCNRNGESDRHGKTYIVSYREENVSSLEDIKEAQEAAETRLRKNKDVDLLMPDAMQAYYEQYFFNRKGIMDCPAQRYNNDFDTRQTMYSFLASNQIARNEYRKNSGGVYQKPFPQSYKTAASIFQPIENINTVGVIVYYGKSKELINRLYETDDFKERKELLRSLQRYTVNMIMTSKKFIELKMSSAFEQALFDGSVLILTESCYSEETGVTSELTSLIL
ncbi:MAG: CRISPR-associated helicase Cas3' [Clostridia bacterium]|nr:CRISPR-associated helicase Cas3' [Clostridia bacterium]